MNPQKTSRGALGILSSLWWLALAVGCFQGAYASIHFPAVGWLILGYAFALVRLTEQPTARRAFYFGLAAGFFSVTPQLFFFWKIFRISAFVLWLVLAIWVAFFALLVNVCTRRWGENKIVWLVPVIWTGLEYFRSELYILKFSWLNIGYALPPALNGLGMYGSGFLVMLLAAAIWHGIHNFPRIKTAGIILLSIVILWGGVVWHSQERATLASAPALSIAGVQMEFPIEKIVPRALSQALAKNTNAQIFALSEYTFDGPVPERLKKWCRENKRFVVVGGKDFVTNEVYYNTAFVIDTNGTVVFKQAKSVPIQFFDDGLPAPNQAVWNSPWGKIGIGICYDLSFTRVTDRLVAQGAQLLIVPTMDVMEWGWHQHELHSRVAPVRAAEYGVPIFRLASSGISQAVNAQGEVIAKTHINGIAEILSAQLKLPTQSSLPPDRYIAPLCTALIPVLIIVLLLPIRKSRQSSAGQI